MSRLKLLLSIAVLMVATISSQAFAQDDQAHYVGATAGQSMILLGTTDRRYVIGAFYQYTRHDHALSTKRNPAQLVYELNINTNHGGGYDGYPNDSELAYGAIAFARFHLGRDRGRPRAFVDLGEGIQYAQHPTSDLDSVLNSTPILDLGLEVPGRKTDFLLGVRWLHISNAGLKGSNDGQNELLGFIAIRV